MRRWLPILLLFLIPAARAQNPTIQGWCETGAQPVVTSGLTSSTQVQQSFPACTVTVFIHGGGLATIFSDASNTPLSNPFTAQSNGRWLFYAAAGRYDVQMSGAGFPSPVTYPDINTSGGGGGGGSISGMTAGQVAIAGSATSITSSKPLVGTDANVLSAGAVTGLGQGLCVDSNGGATTTGCANSFGQFTVLATGLASAGGQTLFCDTQNMPGQIGPATPVTCSVTGTALTCSQSVFVAGDVGKTVWGGNGANVTIADQAIAAFVSGTQVTLTSAALSNGALTVLRWGHDDTPAWDVVNTAFNALLLAGPYCLILPSGMTTFKHATLVVNPTTGYNLDNYGACYRAFGTLVFSPVPDFNYAFFNPTASNIELISTSQGTAFGPSPNPSYVENVFVDGGSVNSGGGACNMAGHIQQGIFLGQAEVRNVGVNNWCPAVANWMPMVINNVAVLYNAQCLGSGIQCATVSSGSDFAPTEFIGGYFGGAQGVTGCGLEWTSSINTSHVIFQGTSNEACPQGGTWHSYGDSFAQAGGGGPRSGIVTNSTAQSIYLNDCFGQTTTGFDWLITGGSSVTAYLKNCKLNAGAGQKWANSATNGGTIYDLGGNQITGSFASDSIPTTANGIFGVGTGVATFNTTLFLVAPASTNTAFTNTTATTSSGVAPFTGTIANLACTATAGASVGGDGIVTVRIAPLSTGTFAATTLTATFGTTTSAKDQTHTASITQGQPIQFQVVTNNAGSETLAGVQCRVSEY